MKYFAVLTAFIIATVCNTPAFSAEQQLNLQLGKVQLMTLPIQPHRVVVGNAEGLNAEVDGTKLYLRGLKPLLTNLVILDKTGQTIAEFDVLIAEADSSDRIVMFDQSGQTAHFVTK
jgi:Flp pilus assembly secretin CpaC